MIGVYIVLVLCAMLRYDDFLHIKILFDKIIYFCHEVKTERKSKSLMLLCCVVR